MYDELHLQCNNLKAIQESKFFVKAFVGNTSPVSFHFSFLFFSFWNMELSSKTQNNSRISAECLLKSFCLQVCTRTGRRECLKKSPSCYVLLSFYRRLKLGKHNDTSSQDLGYACLCPFPGHEELPIIQLLNEKRALIDVSFSEIFLVLFCHSTASYTSLSQVQSIVNMCKSLGYQQLILSHVKIKI